MSQTFDVTNENYLARKPVIYLKIAKQLRLDHVSGD